MSTPPPGASTPLVAVDTGGTFTDLVLLSGGRVSRLKVPSTPRDPAQAVLDGLRSLLGPGGPFVLLHGSTVATNALLERRGARVVLVTNEGFEDVIEIGRQNRPQLYALVGERLPPLVERSDRLGVAGRLGPRGEEIQFQDPGELGRLSESISGREADAVAICLLHAYANDTHERRVFEAIRHLGLPVSVSSRLVPEFREYERTSTTVVNAYVSPLMDAYLGRIASEAGAEYVRIMGSSGGALPIERARREPVHTVLSGPAGGVVGALTWARRSGVDSVITFDMGGTSTDVSLCPGRPLRTREFEIAGQAVAVPVIDIHTVGAGGGSIARVDPGGALRVGPRSAGAQPGPAAYGRGGENVTVTDAHVWLGRLPADSFLGGERPLDREAAGAPLADVAKRLGGSMEEAAAGVVEVANAAMERALRVISVERGFDPADFAVVAFGGAGGLHVAELVARLGARKAIVPPDPGLLSAYGMLVSPVTREASRTVLVDAGASSAEESIAATLDELESEARRSMQEEGTDPDVLVAERWIDARYRGQSFELGVAADGWVDRFHTAHKARYGYERREAPVEAVTVRVVVTAPSPPVTSPPLGKAVAPAEGRPSRVYFDGRSGTALRYLRQDLRGGHELHGPAVIEEYSGTCWVPPDWSVRVDDHGCLHLAPA